MTQQSTPVASVEDGAWSVQTRRTDDGLAGLGADWDQLFQRCAAATPFQSYAWLASWWHTYGQAGRLRLILVRHRGRLVAAAPFLLRRRAGCPVLAPLGGPLADFCDVLIDDEVAAQAAARLTDALLREPGWQAIDLPETRPDAVIGATLWDAWPGGRWQIPASRCFELPAMSMEDLVHDLPARTRKTVRRRLNQLNRAEPEIREVTAADADRAVADLLRLHRHQWQGRGINQHHLTPAFAEHLTRSTRDMLGSGQAALLEYRFDGRLMASSLLLVGPDLVGGYLYGMDPTLRDRVDVTTMMLADTLPMAQRRGCSTMSMLRGAEPYKLRWRPRESQNRRILLARPGSITGTAYATGVRAVRAAVQVAKRRAPWLRAVRDRVRAR